MLAAAATAASADDRHWVGYQYGGGAGGWHTSASWFDADQWLGFSVPTPDDRAIIDTSFDPQGNGMPCIIHFGAFTVPADPPWIPRPYTIAGGDGRVKELLLRRGSFEFRFDDAGGGPAARLDVDEFILIGEAVWGWTEDVFAELRVLGGQLAHPSEENWAGLVLGGGFRSTGRLVVEGPEASFECGRDIWLGNGGGTGDLDVRAGGSARARQIGTGLYDGPTGQLSAAVVTVSGVGSEVVGISGINNGTIHVSEGAVLSSSRPDGTTHFAFLGVSDGAEASATIIGAGSRWEDIDWLTIGGVYHTDTTGSGTVMILDGGRVECQRGIVAERPSTTGSVTVDGPGSAWAISGQLVVGNAPPEDGGDGDLTIRDGGQVTCGTMGIGSTGSLSIELSSASTAPAIVASGSAMLGGSLSVTLAAGFKPAPGVPIPLVSSGSLSGSFSATSLPPNAILEQAGNQLRVIFAEASVGLQITPGKLQATVGYATQATATAIGKSGSMVVVSSLATWDSSDPAVLSVDADGTLFGWAPGRATVSASYEGLVAYADVTVASPTSPPAFEILSVTAEGLQSDASVPNSFPELSDDNELVLIWTSSEVLTGPTPGPIDIIVKDRVSGTIDLVNRNASGAVLVIPTSFYATMSGDGRHVAFTTGDPAAIPNAPVGDQVYVRDRHTGTLELVSMADDGSMPNGPSGPGWISGNGRFVAFRSTATNLVSGVSGISVGGNQIYLRDRLAGTTTILSAANGVAANGNHALAVAITPGGEYVTFQSIASNLVQGDTNGLVDVFRVTTATGAIERVSLSESGDQAVGGNSIAADISDDGQRVLFLSEATNLVPGQNGLQHVYLRDLAAGTTVLVSRTESGDFSTGGCGSIAISGDGSYASFRTSGSLVAADTNSSDDVYRYDIEDGGVQLVSASSVSADAVGGSLFTAISKNGGVVVFASSSSELTPFDQNGVSDWFLWRDTTPVLGDLDGDNAVTASDLAILLGAWGSSGPGDLNGDGVVGSEDLAILLGAWN